MWCAAAGAIEGGEQRLRCRFCADFRVVAESGNLTHIAEVCSLPYSERIGVDMYHKQERSATYAALAVGSWCETCVRNDGTADPLTADGRTAANVAMMGPFDITAFIFASLVVAFTVVGELKDIELCNISIDHAYERLSRSWRFVLLLLGGVRRWVFLPVLVLNVPMLVLHRGGDALSVCFNTIAILFLCDIDNIAFTVGLGERARARVEDVGRVELGDQELQLLARTKKAHVTLLVAVLLTTVWSEVSGWLLTLFLLYFSLWLGGVVGSIVPGAAASENWKRVAKVTRECALGMVGFTTLMAVVVLAA
jgi:hypothetical protein